MQPRYNEKVQTLTGTQSTGVNFDRVMENIARMFDTYGQRDLPMFSGRQVQRNLQNRMNTAQGLMNALMPFFATTTQTQQQPKPLLPAYMQRGWGSGGGGGSNIMFMPGAERPPGIQGAPTPQLGAMGHYMNRATGGSSPQQVSSSAGGAGYLAPPVSGIGQAVGQMSGNVAQTLAGLAPLFQ